MMSRIDNQDPGHWYAVRIRPRHEKVVRQQLEQKNIEAFLPTVARRTNRRKIDWPLFPGYCFARFDPIDRLPILTCIGVLNIVAFGRTLVAIPDHEVDGIRLLVGSKLAYDACPPLREGAIVEVVRGPLRGIIGRLLQQEINRASIVLSVDLIGHGARVEVDSMDVIPHVPTGQRPS